MQRGASSWTALAAGLLVLAASTAAGALSAVQTVSATPATKVPVTLDSTHGSIVSPFTTASLTGIALPLGGITPTTVLTIQHGTASWSVVMAVTAKSGFTPITDSVVLTLVGASSSALTLTSGTPSLPALTSAITLGTTSDLTITARGVCVGTCSITLELRFTSAAATVPSFVLPVTLSVT